MTHRTTEKRLLVEGRDEQRLIPELVECNGVVWGNTAAEAIVYIDEFNGVDNLLKPGVIEAELKSSGLRQLGIVVDADGDCQKRWNSVKARCLNAFPDLPAVIPEMGLVVTSGNGLSLGVWIMPDNQSSGMLETFLTYLVGVQTDPVFQHAVSSAATAKKLGASFGELHESKAQIHTWLAWQNPPGRQMHQAISQQILNAKSVYSQPFIDWFRHLYKL